MRREFVLAAVLLLIPAAARAAIRPSFLLPQLAWNASHVALITEGERIDGAVVVIESLTGDLRPGARLAFPDLAAFASVESRTVDYPFRQRAEGDPERVDGSRMMLFLRKEEGPEGPVFRPAAKWGGLRVSVAWLSGDRAYGLVQVINPGSAVLVGLGLGEKEMRERVVATAGIRRDLEAIAAGPDPAARAARAAPYTKSDHPAAAHLAFGILGGAGKDALPALREMLADPVRICIHPAAIEALAAAGGDAAVPDLVAIVEEETAFWRATAPGLQRGWWNGKGLEWEDVGPLRDRYSRVHGALRALEGLRSPACRAAVTALRDLWRSLPQLEDRSGLDQISRACDRVLAGLGGK